jgi:hypothetical protein
MFWVFEIFEINSLNVSHSTKHQFFIEFEWHKCQINIQICEMLSLLLTLNVQNVELASNILNVQFILIVKNV